MGKSRYCIESGQRLVGFGGIYKDVVEMKCSASPINGVWYIECGWCQRMVRPVKRNGHYWFPTHKQLLQLVNISGL